MNKRGMMSLTSRISEWLMARLPSQSHNPRRVSQCAEAGCHPPTFVHVDECLATTQDGRRDTESLPNNTLPCVVDH